MEDKWVFQSGIFKYIFESLCQGQEREVELSIICIAGQWLVISTRISLKKMKVAKEMTAAMLSKTKMEQSLSVLERSVGGGRKEKKG